MGVEGRGAKVEGERESQANSTLSMELDLMTLRSHPEMKPRVRGLTTCTIQVPQEFTLEILCLAEC